MQELALSLATLLGYQQLLPSLSKEPTPTNRRSSLADFDGLINRSTLTNEREVVERIIFLFMRVLGMSDFKDEHQEVI